MLSARPPRGKPCSLLAIDPLPEPGTPLAWGLGSSHKLAEAPSLGFRQMRTCCLLKAWGPGVRSKQGQQPSQGSG